MKKNQEFYVVLSYGKGNSSVKIKMVAENLADVLMCARGWLLASCAAQNVHVYDANGFCYGGYSI